jgi:hypothetical protein
MTPKQGIIICCMSILLWGSAHAERDWYKYENAYFIAFSDDGHRSVLKTLEELERFRAAVIQVASIKIPEDAPKVRVLIFASMTEFQSLIGNIYINGIATSYGGIPYIVFADRQGSKWVEETGRHEYAHVLLTYKNFPYPMWFNEGFAEMMSTTTFRKRNSVFSVGEYPGRQIYSQNLTPWDELISKDFDLHAIEEWGRRSDAYLQSWLLTYYFMLDDDFAHNDVFLTYLTELAKGQTSASAFETAVGEPIDQFANKLLRKYTKRKVQYVTYEMQPALLDEEFERTAVSFDKVAPIIETLRERNREN